MNISKAITITFENKEIDFLKEIMVSAERIDHEISSQSKGLAISIIKTLGD